MLRGPRRVFNKKAGFTLMEVLLSTVLLSLIFMASLALYNASQRIYFTASDKVIIGYELQYAIEHIYKNVMSGIGDKNNPAVEIAADNLEFTVRHIDKTDPDDLPTYGNYGDDTDVSYKIDTATQELLFDGNGDGTFEETLASKIDILAVDADSGEELSNFTADGNALIIKLTGEFPTARAGTKQRMTLYAECYPRLASFN